jgi:hypothetical protein
MVTHELLAGTAAIERERPEEAGCGPRSTPAAQRVSAATRRRTYQSFGVAADHGEASGAGRRVDSRGRPGVPARAEPATIRQQQVRSRTARRKRLESPCNGRVEVRSVAAASPLPRTLDRPLYPMGRLRVKRQSPTPMAETDLPLTLRCLECRRGSDASDWCAYPTSDEVPRITLASRRTRRVVSRRREFRLRAMMLVPSPAQG